MRPNELLFWLSGRRRGSWQQYRQAVEEIHSADDGATSDEAGDFPLHQRLRLDLQRLAHAEFFTEGCENGWRVVPPTLAAHTSLGRIRGVLCGARSPEMCRRSLMQVEGVTTEMLEPTGAPDVFRFTAMEVRNLERLASEIGLLYQPEAPVEILTALPPCVPPPSTKRPCDLPQGADWRIQRFDARTLSWRKADRAELGTFGFGVLRFSIYFQPDRYFLRWRGEFFEMPRGVAIFAVLHRYRIRVAQYNRTSAIFSVPAICRPPRLLERALVICSGLPPEYAQGRLFYGDVPSEVARLAGELLKQPLT